MKEAVSFFLRRGGTQPLNASAQPGPIRLTERITQVRGRANQALSRFTSASNAGSREIILLHDGRLVGLKFGLGVFQARWLIGDDTLQLFRENQPLTHVSIDDSNEARRAA